MQYLRRIKKGSRFRFDGLGEYDHPALFHERFDQVGYQSTIHQPNQSIRQLLLVRFDELVFQLQFLPYVCVVKAGEAFKEFLIIRIFI